MSWLLAFAFLAASFALAQSLDPAAESEQARQLMAGGHPEAALPIYRRLVAAYPSNPDLLLNVCIAEFSTGDYRGAISDALAALKLKPDLAPANLFLGASYRKLGEYARAVDPLRKAVAASPDDRNALLMLAQTYDSLADLAARELQTSAPDSSYWLTLAGDTYLKQRRFGSAFNAYRDALAHGPLIPGIHAGLAQVYRQTGHAQWTAEEEVSEQKVSPLVTTDTGPAASYAACRSYRELAAEAYARLTSLPPFLESRVYRAKTLDAEGRHRDASIEWRAALALTPHDKSVRLALAQSLYDSRDYEAALPVLADLLKQDPDSSAADFLYGASLVSLERPEPAIPYLESALRHDPELLAAKAALGQALLRLGKPEQAIPYLKSATSGDNDGSARFQLFRAYQLSGNQALASEAFADYNRFRTSLEQQRSMEDGSQITAPPR